MDGRQYPGAAGVALALLLVLGRPAEAVERGRAETAGDGVDVLFMRQGDGTARSATPGMGCDWHASAYTAVGDFGRLPPEAVSQRPSEEHELYVIWCGSGAPSLTWLGPSNFVDPTGPILDEILRRVAVRPALVDVRPDNRGITGIESLFWLEGPGTQQFSETVSAFGITVVVTVDLAGVEWDFGDGTPVVRAGLGEAWPERSSVKHAYERSSGDTPYTVTARLIFQPRFTVNGAPGAPLDPIVVPVEREYVVRQVQAVRQY